MGNSSRGRRAQSSSKPHTILVSTGQDYPGVVSVAGATVNAVWHITVPLQARVYHKACAKRAGLVSTMALPPEHFGKVSCTHCGRAIAALNKGKKG